MPSVEAKRAVARSRRRSALAASALSLVGGASCAPARAPVRLEPPETAVHLDPACDLVPAAGVSWVVAAKPRSIAEIADLIPALARVFPEDRLQAFSASHGGIDLRQIKDLCVGRVGDTVLAVGRVPLEQERVTAAFEERATTTVTRSFLSERPRVVRISGDVGAEHRQLTVFGRDAFAFELGAPGPLRAAEAFAFQRLKKASPALRGAALRRAVEVLGDAPARAFVAGPFEGEIAAGLGGLLRAATAIGGSVTWAGARAELSVRIVLTGAWGSDAGAAAERFAAAFHVLSESAAGRLFGIDRPKRAPSVRVEDGALVLDLVIDGDSLARGIHDAVDADVADIMRR